MCKIRACPSFRQLIVLLALFENREARARVLVRDVQRLKPLCRRRFSTLCELSFPEQRGLDGFLAELSPASLLR